MFPRDATRLTNRDNPSFILHASSHMKLVVTTVGNTILQPLINTNNRLAERYFAGKYFAFPPDFFNYNN